MDQRKSSSNEPDNWLQNINLVVQTLVVESVVECYWLVFTSSIQPSSHDTWVPLVFKTCQGRPHLQMLLALCILSCSMHLIIFYIIRTSLCETWNLNELSLCFVYKGMRESVSQCPLHSSCSPVLFVLNKTLICSMQYILYTCFIFIQICFWNYFQTLMW